MKKCYLNKKIKKNFAWKVKPWVQALHFKKKLTVTHMIPNFTVWKLHSLNPAPLNVPWNLMTIETNNKGVKLSVWGKKIHGLLEQTSWGSAENHNRSQTTQIILEKICQELPVSLNLRGTPTPRLSTPTNMLGGTNSYRTGEQSPEM